MEPEVSKVEVLMNDPDLLNLAMALPKGFSFDACPDRDLPAEITRHYLVFCRDHGRCPVTTNPSFVRWAVEEVLLRWALILGYYDEVLH